MSRCSVTRGRAEATQRPGTASVCCCSLTRQQGQDIGAQEAALIVAVMSAVMARPPDRRTPRMLPQSGVQLGVSGAFHDRPEAMLSCRAATRPVRGADEPHTRSQNPTVFAAGEHVDATCGA